MALRCRAFSLLLIFCVPHSVTREAGKAFGAVKPEHALFMWKPGVWESFQCNCCCVCQRSGEIVNANLGLALPSHPFSPVACLKFVWGFQQPHFTPARAKTSCVFSGSENGKHNHFNLPCSHHLRNYDDPSF